MAHGGHERFVIQRLSWVLPDDPRLVDMTSVMVQRESGARKGVFNGVRKHDVVEYVHILQC